MTQEKTMLQGYKKVNECEKKLLKAFEGSNKSPFFEAIYMSQYSYLSMQKD